LAALWAQLRPRTRIALIALTLAAIGGVAFLAKAQYSSSLQQIRLYRDSRYPYRIGAPGPGAIAPKLELHSTAGRSFNLASQRGRQRVLLVFERLLNRNQISALDEDAARFRGAGIGSIVVVVAHRVAEVARVNGSTVSTSVLLDPGGTVSNRYSTSEASQTFVLVGKDGRIVWRADYGKSRTAARTIPVDVLLDQLAAVRSR
jgi:peroxiredoxin